MKRVLVISLCMATVVVTGCVRRTVSTSPPMGSTSSRNEYSGNNKLVEEKTIWFWQDEFRNPAK